MHVAEPQRTHPATGRLMRELLGRSDGTLAELLRAQADATPGAPFVHWNGCDTTYEEAVLEAERFAGFLRALGAEHRGRVATYLPNCLEALWSWLGTTLSGAVHVPLNRQHKGAILADMLDRAGARVLVCDEDALADLPSPAEALLDHVIVTAGDGSAADDGGLAGRIHRWEDVAASAPWSGVASPPDAVGTIVYTSGSTGRSKAVQMPYNQHGRGGALVAEALGLNGDDRWHCWAPHFHVYAQIYPIASTIAAGASVSLRPRFSRSGYWAEVEDARCTVIGGMANVMRRVWEVADDGGAKARRVRLALISGRFDDLHGAFERRYRLEIVDCFGMTEAEPVTLPVPGHQPTGAHGLPSPDYELTILDDGDRPLGPGEVGEIACRPRRPGVMFLGYEHDAEQTVAAWRNLWFHTGDLGFLDDQGFLHYLARRTDGIRRLGENISPAELEAVVIEHSAVSGVVAVGVPGPPGEEDVKLVCTLAAPLEPAELRDWCLQRMAAFMVPRYVEFVDVLPTLTLGKIDRTRIRYVDDRVWDAEAAAG